MYFCRAVQGVRSSFKTHFAESMFYKNNKNDLCHKSQMDKKLHALEAEADLEE